MKCPDCGTENLAGAEECSSCSAPMAQLAAQRTKPASTMLDKILSGTIAELGPRDAVFVREGASVLDAVKLMRRHKTGCVLVTRGQEVIGILTERDLLVNLPPRKDPSKILAVDVMHLRPQALSEDDSIAFAFHRMALQGYRHVPVTRDDGRTGVISSRDLLRYLCR